jgi:hypothetical protein
MSEISTYVDGTSVCTRQVVYLGRLLFHGRVDEISLAFSRLVHYLQSEISWHKGTRNQR